MFAGNPFDSLNNNFSHRNVKKKVLKKRNVKVVSAIVIRKSNVISLSYIIADLKLKNF